MNLCNQISSFGDGRPSQMTRTTDNQSLRGHVKQSGRSRENHACIYIVVSQSLLLFMFYWQMRTLRAQHRERTGRHCKVWSFQGGNLDGY